MEITLTKDATCADCGAALPAGTRARWYRSGKAYGLDCHKSAARRRERTAYERGDRSPGAIASHYDRRGAYTSDGTYLGHGGPRCEDAPCCGCCP
jgi:hypothetical protein